MLFFDDCFCMRVCIGGTFDHLHKGHVALINKAFEVAGEDGFVFIGLTLRKMDSKKNDIQCFGKRKQNLENFLEQKKSDVEYDIRSISDKYGPSIEGDFDAIVVSPETKHVALEINSEREKIDKKPLKIFIIDYVLSSDGEPISSSRIRNDKIDKEGNIV